MQFSVFDLYRVGIGPSSSHTVGPMRAAHLFANEAAKLPGVAEVRLTLHGSLGATGKGHCTDSACLLGLMGESPESVDPSGVSQKLSAAASSQSLTLPGGATVRIDPEKGIEFAADDVLAYHTNGLTMRALDASGKLLLKRIYFSVGGGFVVGENGQELSVKASGQSDVAIPYPYESATELVELCRENNLTIAALTRANEAARLGSAEAVDARLDALWSVMDAAIGRGLVTEGIMPGGLNRPRRAPRLWKRICTHPELIAKDPLAVLDWVNAYAMAVSEENATGGRVVTAPTNGAAGTVPAVAKYLETFVVTANRHCVRDFLLTAGAIGLLYKANASISGAEVGCQGEVGVACSMAAAGLCAALGGTVRQVEEAAEVAMEHCLGLTCDPVMGLVQIPCIERNAVAAVKAINAARLALSGDGTHFVSLDKVIRTMRDTGHDMASQYKETSRGGLAVCMAEC